MEMKKILSAIDHTLLSADSAWEEIKTLCDEGMYYQTASVCIPPSYVKAASEYMKGRLPVCTVIGFPNGYSTTASKCFEAEDAINNGADEIDMVINIGRLKNKEYDYILKEIEKVKAVCNKKILKVIVEACLLTEQEKIKMCEIISESGADYIKTSTGFSKAGAVREDVILFSKHIKPHVKIKAAGGIASVSDAEAFIKAGASRLGTSRIIKILKSEEKSQCRY